MIALAYREQLPQNVVDELDQLIQGMTAGMLYVQHTPEGEHTNITADSLTMNPPNLNNGVTGEIIFQDEKGNQVVLGRTFLDGTVITIKNGNSILLQRTDVAGAVEALLRLGLISLGPATNPGIEVYSPTDRAWSWLSGNNAVGPAFLLGDQTANVSPLMLRWNNARSAWEWAKTTGALGPTTEIVALGSPTDSSLQAYFDEAYLKRVSMQTLANQHAFAGEWTDVAFSAGNFTGSGSMTWTVGSIDQVTLAYMIVGHTMTVAFYIDTSTVGGTPSTELRIAVPGGYTIAGRTMRSAGFASDNGTIGPCMVQAGVGQTFLQIFNSTFTPWAASTDTTMVSGQITFSING